MDFNKRLKRLREIKEVKQKEVAKYIGVSERVYGYYEKDRFPKDPNTIEKIANYFNVTVDFLLGKEKIPREAFENKKESDPKSEYYFVIEKAKSSNISPERIDKLLDYLIGDK
jgi:transcriptional regulator with XRE-family HTH domain